MACEGLHCHALAILPLLHFSITGMNRFCRFITIVHIAPSPSRDLARFSLMHGIKQPHLPTLKQDSRPPASDEEFSPGIVTHNEDAQVSNVVTLTETPAPAPVSQ
jgi:hypothetical protein